MRGAHLKKLRRAEGGAKILGYFVWKITILRQKIKIFQLPREARKFLRYFVWKITILRQKIIFFPILEGRAPGAPPPPPPTPWIRPWNMCFFEPTWPFYLKFNLSKTIYFLKRTWFLYVLSKYQGMLKILQWNARLRKTPTLKIARSSPKNSLFIGHASNPP